jgi:lysozyme
MKLHPRVTRSLVELVKRFEGLRRRAARLPDGGFTLGYGHTRAAREGGVVTPEDAEALLYYDLSEVAEKVDAWTFAPLNQNQFEALTAFAFNIGLQNFRCSTVLKRLNEGHYLEAAAALELWRKADFEGEELVIDALVRRRAAEKAHFLTPPGGFRPSPTPVLRPTFDDSVIKAAAVVRARDATLIAESLEGETATASAVNATPPPPLGAAPLNAKSAGSVAAENLSRVLSEDTAAPPSPPKPSGFKADGPNPPLNDVAEPPPFGPGVFAPALSAADSQTETEALDDPAFRQPFGAPPLDGHADETISAFHPALSETKAERTHTLRPRLASDRSIAVYMVGLLGVALLIAALFSIFAGKATAVNLVVGLIGVLLMTPAAGFAFLKVFAGSQSAGEA